MNFIQRIFRFFIPSGLINQCIVADKIKNNERSLVLGAGSKLYEETKVTNLQNQKEAIRIGKGSHVRGNLQVFAYGGKITIGDNTYIGEHSYIWSGDEIKIGSNVLISHFVNVIDSNSHELDAKERAKGFSDLITQGHPKNKGTIQTKPIIIGDHCWINFNSIILKGVTIGEGAIVAAGSVVTKDVEPYTMVAGNPAVLVKKLTVTA